MLYIHVTCVYLASHDDTSVPRVHEFLLLSVGGVMLTPKMYRLVCVGVYVFFCFIPLLPEVPAV